MVAHHEHRAELSVEATTGDDGLVPSMHRVLQQSFYRCDDRE